MPAPAATGLIGVNPEQVPETFPASRLFVFLMPVIAVAGITAALAAAAAFLRWHRDEMLLIASAAGVAATVPAIFLLLRMRSERAGVQRAVAAAQARVGAIIESAMDAIITVDEAQRVVQFNTAAETVFGCPREQALGTALEGFIPERYRAGHAAHVRRFGEAGTTSRRMGRQRIVMGLRRNGEEFPIEASISQINEHGRRYYTVILRDVTERWLADEALRSSREEIRELAISASTAREQEKARVARELHDELGQALTALKIDVGWLRSELGREAAVPVREKIEAMHALIDGTVAAARRISSELRPLMLDDLGLGAACDWLVENFRTRTGVECELVMSGDVDLPDPWATAVFRVLQESLTNAAKHARAQRVEVTLVRGAEEIALTVRDDGVGFATDGPRKPGTHGLTGLKERSSLLDGAVRVESNPGRGTIVELHLPLQGKGPA